MNDVKTHLSEQPFSAEYIKEKLEAVMPEVHRQVKIYEEKLKAGKLSPAPKNNPLFGR